MATIYTPANPRLMPSLKNIAQGLLGKVVSVQK